MSLWLKLAALGGLLAALSGAVWYVHHRWWAEGYNQRAAQDARALAKAQRVQTVIDTRVVTQYRTVTRVIHTRGRTILKKVPVYVTRYDNSRCVINNGFVRLWNDANRMLLPTAPSALDEAPSSVTLSDAEAEHSREATICHANSAQLRALQEWVLETHHGH